MSNKTTKLNEEKEQNNTKDKLNENVLNNMLKQFKIKPKSTKHRYRNLGQRKDRTNIYKKKPWDLFPGAYFQPKSLKIHIKKSAKILCLKSIEQWCKKIKKHKPKWLPKSMKNRSHNPYLKKL